MSREDVDTIRKGFDGFNRGDLDAVVAMCDPAVEWHSPQELPGPTAYRGHDGVRAATGDMLELFGDLRADPERFIDAGDKVIAFFRWHGHGKGSGLSLDQFGRQAGVFTMRDGKAIRVDWYLDRVKALEAAGVSDEGA
jgi:uncharacterized protein